LFQADLFYPTKNSGQLANVAKRLQTSLPLSERVRKVKKQKRTPKPKPTTEVNVSPAKQLIPFANKYFYFLLISAPSLSSNDA